MRFEEAGKLTWHVALLDPSAVNTAGQDLTDASVMKLCLAVVVDNRALRR